jgi:hypothetical protein
LQVIDEISLGEGAVYRVVLLRPCSRHLDMIVGLPCQSKQEISRCLHLGSRRTLLFQIALYIPLIAAIRNRGGANWF